MKIFLFVFLLIWMNHGRIIHLKDRIVNTQSEDYKSLKRDFPKGNLKVYLVDVGYPVQGHVQGKLEALVSVEEMIPPSTFVVRDVDGNIDEVAGMEEVGWIGEYLVEYRREKVVVFENAVGMSVRLFKNSNANEIAQRLGTLLSVHAFISDLSSQRIMIVFRRSLSQAEIDAVLDVLYGQEEVNLVLPILKPEVLNYDAIRIVTGQRDISNPTGTNPFHQNNIKGQNQVVGISDTGIDFGNCFLRDSVSPKITSISKDASTPYSEYFGDTIDTSHRKIVGYVNWQGETDATDAIGGHGTFLASTVAGKIFSGTHKHDGVAPEGKVAFIDIQMTGETDIVIKSIKEATMYWPHFVAGARVHLHAWGTKDFGYTEHSRDFDDFLYHHNTSTVFVPAGNEGLLGNVGNIMSPGTAKNVITVGSSCNTNLAMQDASLDKYSDNRSEYSKLDIKSKPWASYNAMSSFSSRGPTQDSRIKPDIVAPGTLIRSARSNGDPSNWQCGLNYYDGPGLSNCPKDCSNHGACNELTRKCKCSTGYCGNDCSIVSNFVNSQLDCCASDCNDQGTCEQEGGISMRCACDGVRYGPYCTHSWSPLQNNRGFSSMMMQSGTSVASAVAAGAGLLVRQYFVDGYFPTGSKVPSNTITPTNALMKAVFVNSAEQILDHVVRFEKNSSSSYSPDVLEAQIVKQLGSHHRKTLPETGHGLLSLGNGLPFFGYNDFSLFIDQNSALATNEEKVYCFKATHNGDLKVTLAWTDPPSSTAAGKHLINDLDLEVVVGNKPYLGNQLFTTLDGDLKFPIRDQVNNVESIHVQEVVENNRIKITVKGISVALNSPQAFALVARGHLDQHSDDFCPECYVGEQKPCSTPEGQGYRNCTTGGFLGSCIFTECHSGYLLDEGKCIVGSHVRVSRDIIQMQEGTSQSYWITLFDLPKGNVIMTIKSPSNGKRIKVKKESDPQWLPWTTLEFTGLNWNIPQKISVFVESDTIQQGNYNGYITHEAESSDVDYNTRKIPNVLVKVEDINIAYVASNKLNAMMSQQNHVESVKLYLNSTPLAPVYLHYSVPLELQEYVSLQSSDFNSKVRGIVLELNDQNWNSKEQQLILFCEKLPKNFLSAIVFPQITSSDNQYNGITGPPLHISLPAQPQDKEVIIRPSSTGSIHESAFLPFLLLMILMVI